VQGQQHFFVAFKFAAELIDDALGDVANLRGFGLVKRASVDEAVDIRREAVRAAANRRRAVGIVVSSRVRMEMMQATSCSNGESNPSAANSKSAALGNSSTDLRIRRMTVAS
jgi:hypothetical protein